MDAIGLRAATLAALTALATLVPTPAAAAGPVEPAAEEPAQTLPPQDPQPQPAPEEHAESARQQAPYSAPNLNPTQIPSAFVAEWGDYFIASYVYGYEGGGSTSQLTTDGGVSVGMGFGDARRLVAVEVDFNLESVANSNNGGSVDVRLGRELVRTPHFTLQLGAGWLGVASYGDWPQPGGSPYGVVSAAWALRRDDPQFRQVLQVNVGGGDGRFQRLDAVDLASGGVIASVGVELAPNLGLSAGWAGRGVNASLSYVPLRGVPITLSLSGANITNVDDSGRAVALTVAWGGSFRTAAFP
jgi:hypothetical protein